MNPYVFWAIVCLSLAVVIFFFELFLPSGGMLGFIATAALVTGIVLLFNVNTLLGLIGTLVALIAVPLLVLLAMRLWPHTPIFRWLVLKNPQQTDLNAVGAGEPGLVGAEGICLTELRPVGTCLVSGKRYDCISEDGILQTGTRIRVVSADGFQVKVRRLDGTAPL